MDTLPGRPEATRLFTLPVATLQAPLRGTWRSGPGRGSVLRVWDNAGRMRRLGVALVVVLALVSCGPALARAAAPAAVPPGPLVRVELLGETESVRPGETFWIALRQEITPGWHTYWG